ncbi:MAG: hypothetical protein IPI32_00025 [Austwickia sp.]|nr:hypothetical protein [Austwickia sp.]
MGLSDGFRAAMGASSSLSRLFADQTSAASRLAAFTATEEPEKRSEDEYRAEIDAWEERFRAAWAEAVELFAVHALAANEVTVVNKTQTFLHDVQVKLHLDGAVEAQERHGHAERPDWRDLKLPSPPRKWGPTKRDLGRYAGYPASLAASIASQPYMPRPYVPPDASWKTTGSVDVEVVVGDLRPEATFQTDDGDTVLLICGDIPEHVQGTWTATARGYNQVFTGALEVAIAEPAHLTNLVRDFVNLD